MTSTPEAALCARGVSAVLGGSQILDGVDFRADFGRLHCIIGPNGAGKTTLLRILLGLLPPSQGTVECRGAALATMPLITRARRIAYVPQRSELTAALRVDEVVEQGAYCRGRDLNTRELVGNALDQVGLRAFAERNVLSLSGGERRLALIARALCTGAQILCLDEPTACLDIANRLRTLELMRRLARGGYAIICVLHELDDVLRIADKVTLLNGGRVHREGLPGEVIDKQVVRHVYHVDLLPNHAIGFRLPEHEVS